MQVNPGWVTIYYERCSVKIAVPLNIFMKCFSRNYCFLEVTVSTEVLWKLVGRLKYFNPCNTNILNVFIINQLTGFPPSFFSRSKPFIIVIASCCMILNELVLVRADSPPLFYFKLFKPHLRTIFSHFPEYFIVYYSL